MSTARSDVVRWRATSLYSNGSIYWIASPVRTQAASSILNIPTSAMCPKIERAVVAVAQGPPRVMMPMRPCGQQHVPRRT